MPADPEHATRRLRRITRQGRFPDGTLVGTLVHTALRRWLFPDSPSFDRLLTTTAKQAGVVEAADLEKHLNRAGELLARFHADPHWAEIDAARWRAEAWHEVPYSQPDAEGVIDLLYRDAISQWWVVDFKTDEVAAAATLEKLVEQDYRPQVNRYRAATTQLLRQPVQTSICWLDYAARVWWQVVG